MVPIANQLYYVVLFETIILLDDVWVDCSESPIDITTVSLLSESTLLTLGVSLLVASTKRLLRAFNANNL